MTEPAMTEPAGTEPAGTEPAVTEPAVTEPAVTGTHLVEDPLRHRPAPADDPLHRFFWASGADGVLRMLRCSDCGFWLHPPSPSCPVCSSADVAPQPLSGRATVATFTVNVQQWVPDQEPYVYAIVEFPEQDGLRLTTNVVGCPVEDVHIGQAVRAAFVHRHDVSYPVFVPERADD